MWFLAQGERDTRTKKIFEYTWTGPQQKIAYFASQVPYDPFALCLGMPC